MSLDNGLNISLQFTYFPFFLIKKREGGKGREYDTLAIPFLLLKQRAQGRGGGRVMKETVIPL